ncbi:Tic20 family protein [Chamaesiphon sp.]|uniref:Tic20 family protein n=1 Tax=Chamaesiphon sp. TaxID=2814140 RepID=UPI003593FA54
MSGQGSQTVADRFFGSIVYLLPLARVFSFGVFVFQQLPIVQELYLPLAPLLAIDNNQIGGFVLFFGLYLGVVANPKISRFIRFNVLQAILIGILLSLCGLLLQYVLLPILGLGPVTQVLMNTVFFGTWAAGIYGIVMSALGKYTEIPQLSETAQMQVDRY